MGRWLRYAVSAVISQPPTIRVVAAMVSREGHYLITQRRATAILPLLWEFPGGRVELGETDEAALKRELRERLDADIEVGELISFVNHRYEHYTVELYLYECSLLSEQLAVRGVNDARWVRSADFERYEFTPADEASTAKLLGVLI
ncbi:MAG: (deoxy)nucleoside triphosphate pyrophosphohydrolase [Polyangiales bacterium]